VAWRGRVGAGQQQHVAACEGGPRHGRRSQFGPGSRRASRCPGIAAARARRGGVASRRGSVGGFAGGPLLCFRLSRAPVALRSPVTTRTHPPLGSLLLLPRSGLSPALPPFFSRRPPPLAGVRPSSDGSVQRAMPVHGVRKATALMGACACGPDERCWPLQSTAAMGSHVILQNRLRAHEWERPVAFMWPSVCLFQGEITTARSLLASRSGNEPKTCYAPRSRVPDLATGKTRAQLQGLRANCAQQPNAAAMTRSPDGMDIVTGGEPPNYS
jgi:hypothetical protein